MSRYYRISNGLRGCYLHDNFYIVRVDTRRDLKNLIISECAQMAEAHGRGSSARDVVALVARIWRDHHVTGLDYVFPFSQDDGQNWPFGLFVSRATRADFIEYSKSEGF